MINDSSVRVNFANHNFVFRKFQDQYKNLCQDISKEKRNKIHKSLRRLKSFIFEYLAFISYKDFRFYITDNMKSLNLELNNDKTFTKLCDRANKTPNEAIVFNQKYYYYLIKIFRLIGIYGDELSRTFMPNKTDREKLFKYSNNNSFFEKFTIYKSETADIIANFTIRKFKVGFAYVLGFYFAYYLFIDEKSRLLCENVFSNILNIILHKDILNIMVLNYGTLGAEKRELLKDIDYKIHDGISHIFFMCNLSYSQYGVMPKIKQKMLIDKTTM